MYASQYQPVVEPIYRRSDLTGATVFATLLIARDSRQIGVSWLTRIMLHPRLGGVQIQPVEQINKIFPSLFVRGDNEIPVITFHSRVLKLRNAVSAYLIIRTVRLGYSGKFSLLFPKRPLLRYFP